MPSRFVLGCAVSAVACCLIARAPARAGAVGVCNTNFPLQNFSNPGVITLNGNAFISNGNLVLTSNVAGQSGSAWYNAGRTSIADGFDTTFNFVLNGTSDGIAFVLQDQSLTALGSGGSGLGYAGIARALSVEIDTFCFSDEFDCDHISVQTNGVGQVQSDDSSSLGHATLPVDVNDGQTHTLRVVYVPGTLAVFIDGGTLPILSVGVDLTDINGDSIVGVDGCMNFGFTGGTGGATATQLITFWGFTDTATQPPIGCGANFDLPAITNPLDFSLVGSAFLEDGSIVLTPNNEGQAGAAWYRLAKASPFNGFITEFTFTLAGEGDGIAFVLQNESLTALGDAGSGMGYASNGPNGGVTRSLAVEIDTFCFQNEIECDHISIQNNSQGPNQSGDAFSISNLTLTNDLNDGQPHVCRIEYDPGSLSITVDGEGLVAGFNLNEYSLLDENNCILIGFTGGTGGSTARQSISSWSFQSGFGGCEPVDIDSVDFPGPLTVPQGFSVTAIPSGTPPFTFEWYRDGQLLSDGGNIVGTTTETITVMPTNTGDSGQYDVNIYNDCGSISTGTFVSIVPPCPGDADGNGVVNFADITNVLTNFLTNYDPGSGPGDATGDGLVNFADITNVLTNFGTSCP